MKIKTFLILLSLLLFQGSFFSQRIGFESIDAKDVSPWLPKLTLEYQAVYHFGDSEAESDLVIWFGLEETYAQLKFGEWSDDGNAWVWYYENFTNVRIEDNLFYSDQTNGEFVLYNNGEEQIPGLKVEQPWSGNNGDGEFEIGLKSYAFIDYFYGKYPQASLRILEIDVLNKLSKEELQLMRNEIYARYGFEFKEDGKMFNHFKTQDWYAGQHENVDQFITELEKINIQIIQELEGN